MRAWGQVLTAAASAHALSEYAEAALVRGAAGWGSAIIASGNSRGPGRAP